MRAVRDYDVDRPQVLRWRHQSRAVLIARDLPSAPRAAAESRGRGGRKKQARRRQARHPASPEHDAKPQAAAAPQPCASHTQSGGYGGGVPPLPIPNREVKPARADGTAHECGRVGCRPLQTSRPPADSSAGGRFFLRPRPRQGRSPLREPFAAQKRAPADGPPAASPAIPCTLRHAPTARTRSRACRLLLRSRGLLPAARFPVTRPLSRFCP